MSYASDALIDAQECKIEKLQAENAKLRELVNYAMPIAFYGASVEENERLCDLAVAVGYLADDSQQVIERTGELGIEVE